MPSSTTVKWDRHAILAEIKRRYGSLKGFARTTPLTTGHFSVALQRPYPRAERLIAKKLGVAAKDLWPDRYYANGRRRSSSRGGTQAASQKQHASADTEVSS